MFGICGFRKRHAMPGIGTMSLYLKKACENKPVRDIHAQGSINSIGAGGACAEPPMFCARCFCVQDEANIRLLSQNDFARPGHCNSSPSAVLCALQKKDCDANRNHAWNEARCTGQSSPSANLSTHTPPNEKIASKAAPPPTSPTRKPHTLPRVGRRRRALGRRGRAPHRLKHTAWMPSGPGDSSQLLPSGRHGCGLVIVYWCVLSSLVAIEDKRSLSDHFPGNTSNIYG